MKKIVKMLFFLVVVVTGISVFPLKTIGLTIDGQNDGGIIKGSDDFSTETWMRKLANDTPLTRLSVPGTHDTMAYKGSWGAEAGVLNPVERFTKTQNWDLRTQLANGVRFVDIRIDVDMSIHHGIVDLESSLDGDVLPTLRAFLALHPDEIIFARMKSENGDNPTQFDLNIAPILEANKDLFATNINAWSTVGDARGKIVVFDNIGTARSFFNRGYAHTLWNSSDLEKQDNYDNPSRANKQTYIRDKFVASMNAPFSSPTTYVNHISATGSMPFGSTPRDFANDLNPWTVNHINSLNNPSQLGIVIFDFIGTAEINAVMNSNSAYLSPTWGDVRWEFDSSTGELTFLSVGTLGMFDTSPWNRTDKHRVNPSAIKKITFKSSVTAPSNSMFLFTSTSSDGTSFGGLDNLKEFVGFNYLDTTNVTNMSFMFALIGNVKGLYVEGLNTSKVTNMQGMFVSATISSLSLSGWNTSNVTNMANLFTNSSIGSLDISRFDTREVKVNSMFLNTSNLKKLTIGSNFTDVTNSSGLPTLTRNDTYSGNWAKVNGGSVGTTSEFLANLSKTGAGTYVWEERPNLIWGDVQWEFTPSTGNLTLLSGSQIGTYSSSPWNRTDQEKIDGSLIKKITFSQKVKAPTDASYLFGISSVQGLSNLTTIDKLSYLDTSDTTNMSYMFNSMPNLAQLDLSSFQTSSVTNMSYMFNSMAKIDKLDVSSFQTSNVTNMSYMFSSMAKIDKLDLSSFQTSKVTTMNRMFANSSNLVSLNMSNFDMGSVQNKSELFLNDTKLKEIGLNSTFAHSSNVYSLLTIPQTADYTGNWMTKDGQNVGSTTQFLSNLTKTGTGTYVWEETVEYDVAPAFIINR